MAQLFARAPITKQTDDQTILRLAESILKTGNTARAIEVLESALALKTPTRPLYLALASYYERAGNVRKAAELESKGKALEP